MTYANIYEAWVDKLLIRRITLDFCGRLSIGEFFLFLAFIAVTQVVCAEPDTVTHQDYRFSEVDVPELKKIGTQLSIVEDKQGFTWFGGANGLARFDGYNAVTYRHDPKNPRSISYNGISALLSDRKGRLWIATSYGLNRYNENTGEFVRYMVNSPIESKMPTNSVTTMTEDLNGDIWVGTMNAGLIKINGENAQYQPVKITLPAEWQAKEHAIRALCLAENGLIWVGVHNLGLLVFNPETLELQYPVDLSGMTRRVAINTITQGPEGNIWIGTSNSGLLRLNPDSGELKQYTHLPASPTSIHHNTIWDIHFDQNGELWVAADDSLELYLPEVDGFKHFIRLTGTNLYGKVRAIYQTLSGHLWLGMFPSGAAYVDIDATVFRNFVSVPTDVNTLSHTAVTSLVEDAKGNLWIGTEGGLDYLNVENHLFTHYNHEEDNPFSLPSDSVLSLFIDHTNTLWVGTWKGGWARFDEQRQQFHPAKVSSGTDRHMKEEVWEIYEDKTGQLWVGGLYLYDREHDVFKHYTDVYPTGDRLSSERVNVMYEDSHGDFWIGTLSGLNRFNRINGKIKYYSANDHETSLSDDYLFSALEDDEGALWFGTRGGGVNIYNRETDSFNSIGASDGLYDDSITGMVDDHHGSVWLLSGSGLIHYKKATKEFELFNYNNGLKGDLFHRNAIMVSSKNEIILGGAEGLTIFDPKDLKKNSYVPPVVLTELEIFNEPITPISHRDVLNNPIHLADSITLNHHYNVFSIHYSALSYRMPGQNKYAFKLDGFDLAWNQVGHVRRATYTNLDPGHYVLRVKAANNSGLWNEQGVKLDIFILPPWWKTTFAYAGYFLVLMLLGLMVSYIMLRLRRAKNESILNTRLQEVSQIKDAFLANTSHELRTPLNGIIGLAESIMSSTSITSEDARYKLEVVVNCAKRLSNIINDILDFSKLKDHEIDLNKTPIDFYALVKTVFTLLEPLVDSKSVNMVNQVDESFPTILADEQRLSQVLFNILGNAVKFTDRGEVRICATIVAGIIKIEVHDTGVGISAEDCKRIFWPFEQSLSAVKKGVVGTGLGLAVSKKLVELHGGSIDVRSTQGVGSVFVIRLPFISASTHLLSKDKAKIRNLARSHLVPLGRGAMITSATMSGDARHHVLIVDDEPVNRMVLDGYLSHNNYIITECATGEEAIQKIKHDQSIELVLLDVMMPGISGYEVCAELRRTYKLLELPILFLTAKSQNEDLTKGYEVGASDFLFKPINKAELLAKVKMHLTFVDQHKNA